MSQPRPPDNEVILTVKEASTLIASIRSGTLIASLKHADFTMIVGIAFAGFRFDVNGLANPLVRRRLAEEAARNPNFARKLRELSESARVDATPAPKPNSSSPTAGATPTSLSKSPAPDRSAEKYREERDRLKREAAEEADRRRTAERDFGHAKIELLAATTLKVEADREASHQKQRAERLERKLRRLELENAQLRRVAGTTPPAVEPPKASDIDTAPASSASGQVGTRNSEAPFIEAVRHLLDKQRWQPARTIAEDVLRSSPTNEEALAIHAAAAEGLGDLRAALHDLRMLIGHQISRADMVAAAHNLARLYVKTADRSTESKVAREFYLALNQSGAHSAEIREIMDVLKATSPTAYDALKEAAQGEATSALFGPRAPGRTSGDDALPIALSAGLPRSVTGRLAASWIDRNDTAIVNGLRAAVASAEGAVLTRLATALAAATEGDASYYRLLSRKTLAGPAVIDASNAAWAGQEMVASPKPRLRQVSALRQALREMGYFPILLIADANFPFVVDDPAAARKMVADGHIVLATGGTDADVLILQEARRLNAPIVSNDYMTDWDPGQEVEKLQYSIAPTSGIVTVYR